MKNKLLLSSIAVCAEDTFEIRFKSMQENLKPLDLCGNIFPNTLIWYQNKLKHLEWNQMLGVRWAWICPSFS